MDDTHVFTLTGVGMDRQRIREIEGRVGVWPFARTLRFCVGVNCDAIEADDHGVAVYRRGRLIARTSSRVSRRTRRTRHLPAAEWLRTLTPR